jgi:hypothetical protein
VPLGGSYPRLFAPQGAVKTLAKDLVRTRNYVTKFIEMRSHLQGAALKLEVRERLTPPLAFLGHSLISLWVELVHYEVLKAPLPLPGRL